MSSINKKQVSTHYGETYQCDNIDFILGRYEYLKSLPNAENISNHKLSLPNREFYRIDEETEHTIVEFTRDDPDSFYFRIQLYQYRIEGIRESASSVEEYTVYPSNKVSPKYHVIYNTETYY